MTCCTYRKRSRRGALDRAPAATAASIEVFGTWDFKWPLGSRIRVAFQLPPGLNADDEDFQAAVAEIRRLAEGWKSPRADIGFDWEAPLFGPPDPRDPQQRSVIDPKQYHDYDVLVSLSPLPLTRQEPVSARAPERVFLPKAELGSYARRVDYAAPTVFLGPVSGALTRGPSLAEYYRTDAMARFYVVHELGHVLGLAHQHQNPKRRARDPLFGQLDGDYLVDASKLATILEKRLHVLVEAQALQDFTEDQIADSWPGNEAFSDWREDLGDSVMLMPYYGCLLGEHAFFTGETCVICESRLRSVPFPSDLAQLEALYPLVERRRAQQ